MKQGKLSNFIHNYDFLLILALCLICTLFCLYKWEEKVVSKYVEPIYFIVEKDEDSTTLTIPKEYHLQFDEHGACTLVRTDSEESK